jgi:TPP-dependent pyruvate/acetoin dehydrogenase alpha subunit
MYDPELYRGKDEVAQWKQRDPIETFAARLRERGLLSDRDMAEMERDVEAEITGAVAVAESGPLEPVGDLLRDVHTPR